MSQIRDKQIRDPRTYEIIGAAMEVHKAFGAGFAEPMYQEALAIELGLRKMQFHREQQLLAIYKGHRLRSTYRVDFICYGDILVELKALAMLTAIERAIVINYLKVSMYRLALLLNFGARSLEYERLILSADGIVESDG